MKLNRFKKLRYGDLEPAIGAPISEGVKYGVTKPAFFVDEKPGGGVGERVALANEGVIGDDSEEGFVEEF